MEKKYVLNVVPSLECLCLRKITSDFLLYKDALKDLPNSLKIELSNIACRREGLFEDVTILKGLLNCETDYLSMRHCHVIDEMLEPIKVCKQLTVLNIGLGASVTTRALCNLIPFMKELEQFSAEQCAAVTDEVILALAYHCPRLIILDVPGCSQIGDKSLISVTNKSLIAINMSGSKITDHGVSHMVFGEAKNHLREVTIDNCYISFKSVDFIIRLCPKLSIFSFRNNRFASGDIELPDMPKLKQLAWTIPL